MKRNSGKTKNDHLSQKVTSPITKAEPEKRFKAALDETNRKHGKTLTALTNK